MNQLAQQRQAGIRHAQIFGWNDMHSPPSRTPLCARQRRRGRLTTAGEESVSAIAAKRRVEAACAQARQRADCLAAHGGVAVAQGALRDRRTRPDATAGRAPRPRRAACGGSSVASDSAITGMADGASRPSTSRAALRAGRCRRG